MEGRGEAGKKFFTGDWERDFLVLSICGLAGCMLASFAARHWLPLWHGPLVKAAAGCLTWTVAIGSARAAAQGLHVRMSFPADAMPVAIRRRVYFLADILFLVFTLIILAVSALLTWDSLVHPAPRGHPLIYASLPVGMLITAKRLIARLRGAERVVRHD